MAIPRSGRTDLKEDIENWRSSLRSQLRHRRQSQTRSSQISTAPISKGQLSIAPHLPTMIADAPGTHRSYWASSDPMHRQLDVSFFHSRPCRNPPPTAIPVTSVPTTAVPPPSSTDTIRPAPTTASTAAAITTTTTSRTPPPMGRSPTTSQPLTSTFPPPAMWTRSISTLTAIEYSSHTSAWLTTCESIA
nr:unnamed protein product [Spirometra erinaceieuropaei]